MGNYDSIPDGSPLKSVLQGWSLYSSKSMKKKKMISFCNHVWPKYQLESGEKWPKNGSLNYNTITQLDSFCKREKKWGEIPYVESFMSLYKRINLHMTFKMMVQKVEPQKKPVLPESKPEGVPVLPLWAPGAVAHPSAPPLPIAPLSAPLPVAPPSAPLEVPVTSDGALPAGGAKASTSPPRVADSALSRWSPLPDGHKGMVSPPCTLQGTQSGPGETLPQAGQFLLRQVPVGLDDQGQPRALGLTPSSSVINLHNYKAKTPSYQDDLKKMETLFTSVFAVFHPNPADIQTLKHIFLSQEEPSTILEKSCLEAERLHYLQPDDPIRTQAELAIPETEPGWDPSDPGDQARLNHYKECLITGLQKGAENFKRVQNVQQGPKEDPFTFHVRLFDALRKYTDIDPEHPDNLGLVKVIFISQSAPDIRKRLQQLERGLWMPTSQLLQIAFEVFNGRDKIREKQEEQNITRQVALRSCNQSRPSRTSGGQNKRQRAKPQGPPKPGQKGHPFVEPRQCAFCRQKGHWKWDCPRNPASLHSLKRASITGVYGEVSHKPFLPRLECHIEKTFVKYNFMYVPECCGPLSGQEQSTHFNAQVPFAGENGDTKALPAQQCALQPAPLQLGDKPQPDVPEEILQNVRADVWADGTPGRAKMAEPVVVRLRPGAQAPKVPQYPLKRHVKEKIKPLIINFLKHKLIRPCQSPYNTPILLVQKPRTEDLFVQDLRAINKIVKEIPSVVPNSYTLLTALSGDFGWFTVLNVKDAFYCIPLSPESQELFAFEWDDPQTNIKQQYCWTVFPQGFKNAATIFMEVFAKDLKDLQLNEGCLLPYVGTILIASKTKEASDQNTILTLNFLADRGYKISKGKSQFSQPTVPFLGIELSKGQRNLLPSRREALAEVEVPATRKQLRRFLAMAEFCRIWIPNFGLIVKPLYEALKRSVNEPLSWTEECLEAFHTIQKKILKAPALGLPDIGKPFDLFVHERQGLSLGVLTQNLDSARRPVAYFSKQLDAVTRGWPVCLQAVAATCDLLQQAEKFTLDCPITVHTPHRVQPLLGQRGSYWLTTKRLKRYKVILFDNRNVTLKEVSALNPDTLLPSTTEEPVHDCIQKIKEDYSSRPDLTDQPLENPDMEMFTHGSSFMDHGLRKAGYAVITHQEILEAEALPPGTSAQKAELVAIRRALHLGAKKKVTIYTDSEYIFSVMHVYGAMWKKKGQLTSGRKKIEHTEEILALLKSVFMPEEVAIVLCPCQETDGYIARGNNLAEQAAKQAARIKHP